MPIVANMGSSCYITHIAVVLTILSTVVSLSHAQGSCCQKVKGCQIPNGCFCPLRLSLCKSDGSTRHFASGKRSFNIGTDLKYFLEEDNVWNEPTLERLLRQQLSTRKSNRGTLVRNLLRRIDFDPELLLDVLRYEKPTISTDEDYYSS